MADNVVPIGRAKAATSNVQCHRCGGEWWRLIRRADVGVISGQVILEATSHGDRIVGYAGYFECVDCGATR